MKHEHYGNFSVADIATKCDDLDLHLVSGAAKWKRGGKVLVAEKAVAKSSNDRRLWFQCT
jgi:hypothetical protein